MANEQDDATLYVVVMNAEEQYSIWPADRDLPLGWTAVRNAAPKQDCLAFINETWTDMRPLSLRLRMEQDQQ